MRASCLGACAFVILLLATSTRAAEPAERQAWLFPILRYGPNNQLRDLRRLLALAKHLERGIILTGVFRHHLDKPQHHKASIKHGSGMCFPQHNGTFIGLDRLLDRGVLEEWLPVATVAELTAQGWSGQLDALVHAKDVLHTQAHEVNRTLEVAGVRLSPNVALITTKESLKCNPTDLRDLQSKVEKHRFIGVILVQLGDSERPDTDDRTDQLESKVRVQSSTRPDVLQAPVGDRCHMAVNEANRLLQPSSWIMNIALQYSQQYLGGEPYLAVHVRPYPDECMEAWRSNEFDASKPLPLSACKPELRHMHMTLGRTVRRLLTRHNLTRLLVVSHPDIRLRITQLLKPAGLVALYVDGPAVERLAGCVDGGPSFLCLVEQQLAAQAGMFLGTARSSITQNIAYLRSGAGLPSTYMK